MSNFLIELSIIHGALITGYWFFLRKELQFSKMRFYLLGSTLLALVIPLLKLPKLFFSSNDAVRIIPMEVIPVNAITIAPSDETSFLNYDLLLWVYLGISTFFLCKFLSGIFYLIKLEQKSSYELFNDTFIRKVHDINGSFTFFNWIFLSDEIDKNQQDYHAILKHEKAHASMGHSYDIIFFELFKICFWWLPTAWFINKEIKKIHEYQADAHVLKSYDINQYSSILISSTLKSNGLSLASSFHDGLIFKRLKAMKKQAKNVSSWKLGVLGSLCAILFVVFACSEELDQETDEILSESTSTKSKLNTEVFTVVEEHPEFVGGTDAFYKYLSREIKYPSEAREKGVEGRVYVEFVVERDGSLSEVKTVKGIGAGCDKEAERVLKNSPSFKPGVQRGKPVRVRMSVPIVFKLDEGELVENQNPEKIIVEEVEAKNMTLKIDASFNNGAWSGTVSDEDGKALPGASIVVVGTTTGTVSDLDGTFKINTYESNDLQISFVGYESVRLAGK
ncbi:TonB family protein [Flexithrix dorotheae]|uniref:TonB family protein n=1 Tax=Flexithrix dorotheae TaxID=70993 RepID=UPI00037C8A6F|nr:TonB family protein [Flexithrix dorotheae]